MLHFEAGSGLNKPYDGARSTWHYGIGYIEPFGPAEYYCGEGFPEIRDTPVPPWVREFFFTLTGVR